VVKAPEAWIGYLEEEEAGNRGDRERKREDE